MLRKGKSSLLFGWEFLPRNMGNEKDKTGVLRSLPGRSLRRRLFALSSSVPLLVTSPILSAPHIPVNTLLTTMKRA